MGCFKFNSLEVDNESMAHEMELECVTTFSFRRGSAIEDNIEFVCEQRYRRIDAIKSKVSMLMDMDELRAVYAFIGKHLDAFTEVENKS